METKGYQHNNLMDFDDLEDNKRNSTSDNSMSWLSILAELEIQPDVTAASSDTTTIGNQSNANPSSYNPFRATQPQEFVNQTYGNAYSGSQRPGDLFLDSLIHNTSNQTFQPTNTSTALNLQGSQSDEDVSPTQSVNTRVGATGFDYNNIRSASTSSLRSLTPPPLPVKVNKYGHFDADSFTASIERLDQSPLQVKLDTNNQESKYVNDMSWKMSDAYEGIGSRTNSVSSTGSFHPYDSISLKKNFSIRSMRSTDSDSSTDRFLQVRNTRGDATVNDTSDPKEFLNETYFNFPETANSVARQEGPLQVKLPDLETEEREFFGYKHSQSSPTVSPSSLKTAETYRYSVGDSKKPQHLTSTSSNTSQSPKDWIPGGGLFEVARERNVEVIAFGKVLSDIRSKFPHDEPSNRGYVLSPALPPSFGEEAYDLDTEVPVVIYTESRRDTIRFIINVHKPVRELIELSISCLSDTYISDTTDSGICNVFLLKVCGKSEYLEAERELVDYEYVQQCLKLQQEVQFVLMESDRVSRALARKADDDDVDLIPRNYKDFFDLTNSTAISQYGLTVLMGAFSDEVTKVLQETTNLVAPRFEPSRIIQSVKAICAMLANIETSEIHSAVDALNELYLQRETPDGHRKAPDSDSIDRILTRLNDSVLMLVEMYCEAFDTDFTASKINRPGLSGTVDISSITENLRIRIASAHRLPFNWKQEYEYFEVQVGVYYGGALLCPIEVTPLSVISKKFLEHLRWDEWLEFQIQVRQLPRESRLCVTLYGYTAITKGTAPHTPQVPLGWVAMQLFNFNGVLASGTQLLGLWPDDKSNPVGACTSNLLHPASVLMLVEFERYLAEIIFPDCIALPIDNVRGDIPEADYGVYEQILEKDLFNELKPEEKKALWDYRYYCCKVSRALPLILSCIESWEYKHLPEIYRLLEVWTPMFPVDAMELLKVNFPDCKVRAMAVRWMGNFSDDELCDYLPQLVQALKYEIYHDSPLARFLIRRALGNVRLMHALFWYLKDKINDPQFGQRFQVILGGLLSVCGDAQREEFTFEDELVAELIKIAQKVKDSPNSGRTNMLQQELAALSGSLPCMFRLPLTPSMEVIGLDVRSCGYFTSNSAPLRLVLSNSDPFGENVNVIFKMGDDMRQDTLTMQLVGIMSKIWFREGLDLKIITYQCMALGPGIGMIEIVGDAQTLREIHTEFGLTGSFKDEPIARWLLKHNPDEKDYRIAVDNFTASCAGYCVATYVLGICDRHNDNIMIRKSGHLFHIDFAKILGHAQMFGTFRRDRAPFVLTPDMAFVINGGYQPSSRFQDFVDLCCRAFNLIRRHDNLFLNLLSLMLNSGISSLSSVHDLKYIRDSLLPNVSEADATATFTRLIHSSLTSWFTQVNFFIHNVAQLREVSQLKRSSSNNPNSVLTFAPKTYTVDTDGYIESARVVDFQKRHTPAEKYYIYVINVCRVTDTKPTFVFRRFVHFQELHTKLLELFPEANLPRLPARIYLRRSQIRTVAEKRRAELDSYLRHILMMPSEIAESDAIYTFLHPLLLDEEEASKFSIQLLPEEKCDRPITGEIKLSLRFERESLRVMVMHAKNLAPRGTSGLADPYVKLYLLPDPEKATKIKTKVAKRTLNPTYNETLVYNNRPRGELDRRQLQVTVWDDRVGENEFLGGVLIDLSTVDLTVTNTRWYDLVDLRK